MNSTLSIISVSKPTITASMLVTIQKKSAPDLYGKIHNNYKQLIVELQHITDSMHLFQEVSIHN